MVKWAEYGLLTRLYVQNCDCEADSCHRLNSAACIPVKLVDCPHAAIARAHVAAKHAFAVRLEYTAARRADRGCEVFALYRR